MTLTPEQREAIKAEAREAAKKELDTVATATKDYVLASRARDTFMTDWKKANPGGDFLTAVSDGSATAKEYDRLTKAVKEVEKRQSEAEDAALKKMDRVFKKHGITTVPDYSIHEVDSPTRFRKDPESKSIGDELLREAFDRAHDVINGRDNPKDGYGGPQAGGSFDSGEEKPKATLKSNLDPAAAAEARQPPTADQAMEELLRNLPRSLSILFEGHSDTIEVPQVPGKGGGRQL